MAKKKTREIAPVSKTPSKASSAKTTSPVRSTPVPRPVTPVVATVVTWDTIAKRAYAISQSGNGGGELDNWLRAERELRSGR